MGVDLIYTIKVVVKLDFGSFDTKKTYMLYNIDYDNIVINHGIVALVDDVHSLLNTYNITYNVGKCDNVKDVIGLIGNGMMKTVGALRAGYDIDNMTENESVLINQSVFKRSDDKLYLPNGGNITRNDALNKRIYHWDRVLASPNEFIFVRLYDDKLYFSDTLKVYFEGGRLVL